MATDERSAAQRREKQAALRRMLRNVRDRSPFARRVPKNMRCVECGADLRPTPEQIDALVRFGNPLRRPPCLKTTSGLHRVAKVKP